MHIEALRPLTEAGKLGCFLFQFLHWFARTAPASITCREACPLRHQVAFVHRHGTAERSSRFLTKAAYQAVPGTEKPLYVQHY
jgi:hypothetical protein